MEPPKTCAFQQNQNVAEFIQNLLENEENNRIGIVKVIEIEKLKKKTPSNVLFMCIMCDLCDDKVRSQVQHSFASATFGRKCTIQSQVKHSVKELVVRKY